MLLKENYQKKIPQRNGGIRLVMKIDRANCPSIGQFYLGPTHPKTHWAYTKLVVFPKRICISLDIRSRNVELFIEPGLL